MAAVKPIMPSITRLMKKVENQEYEVIAGFEEDFPVSSITSER